MQLCVLCRVPRTPQGVQDSFAAPWPALREARDAPGREALLDAMLSGGILGLGPQAARQVKHC